MNEEVEILDGQNGEAENQDVSQNETPVEAVTPQQGTENPENNVSETGNDGKREYTPEERASYSFRKQLRKKQEKFDAKYGELQANYNKLLERLERLEQPDKYQPLNRQHFQTDDDFINALVEEKFKNVWDQRMSEYQKLYDEKAKQEQELNTYRSRQDENVKKLFKTPEAEKQYRDVVGQALQNGMGELIDQDKELSSYIMRSDVAPKLLYNFAMNPSLLEGLFAEGRTDMDRQFMIRQMEQDVRKEIAPKPQVIGKPGIQQETTKGSIFDSDDSILNYLRTH